MTKTIQQAGYVVTNNEAIWAVGATADEAWAAFKAEMARNHTVIVENGQDVPEDGSNWIRASVYQIRSASAALIAKVQGDGGNIAWGKLGDIACTIDEAEAE